MCKHKNYSSIDRWSTLLPNSSITLPPVKVIQYSIVARTDGVTVQTQNTPQDLLAGETANWADVRTSHETPYTHTNPIIITTSPTGEALVRWTEI